MPKPTDNVLVSARREAVVVIACWFVALLWTVGVSYYLGYNRPIEKLAFVMGVPDWIFWGILVPWFGCLAFTAWFSFVFMQDADLDAEHPPEAVAGEAPDAP